MTGSRRTRIRRVPQRAVYDRSPIDEILDEGLVCHLGTVHEGHAIVIPTLYARVGDDVLVHGSAASRTIRALEDGAPATLVVTLIDGLVLARSAFHHSVNYRSVVLYGDVKPVVGDVAKETALRAFVERFAPGRWPHVRPPSAKELKATTVLSMPIDEVSAKVRGGPPVDDPPDYALDVWAGVIPMRLQHLDPIADMTPRPGAE
jgi:nitroimidazol reductase NimA-like FMN-containing flavoprotein (pyridoxamine 5'-phosphate oxidase superfamily)